MRPTAAGAGPALGRPPLALVLPAVAAGLFLLAPLLGLVLSTPWDDLLSLLASTEVQEALWLSVATSLITVGVCVVVGTPLAWLLARVEFPGRGALRAIVVVPLVLPPVVAGVALIAALGRGRPLGDLWTAVFGDPLPYSTAAVVVAHAFVAMPFYVLAVEGAFRATSTGFDAVAATLGASRWTAFRRVTLPLALPGVMSGCALAWARSLGEFGATITFAGNYPGTTRTMPSLIYTRLQSDVDVARTTSMILLLVAVLVIALLRDRWLRVP